MAEDEERRDGDADHTDPGQTEGDHTDAEDAGREQRDGEPTEGAPGTADTTRIQPPTVGPSGTTIMPAVPEPPPAERTVWSARAQVPTPADPDDDDTYAPAQYAPYEAGGYGEPEPRGRLTPTVIAVCVVVLLIAIAVGAWLIVRGLGNSPTPEPTTATTPPATTTQATPATTSAAPATVTIGDLRGQDYAVVAGTLTAQGLRPVRSDELSAAYPAGQVTRTDPAAGTAVPVGSVVTVYVSTGKPSTVPTTTPPATPS